MASVKTPLRAFKSLTQNLIVIVASLRGSIRLVGIVGIIVGIHHVASVIIWGTIW
jgi:hypothetical protein